MVSNTLSAKSLSGQGLGSRYRGKIDCRGLLLVVTCDWLGAEPVKRIPSDTASANATIYIYPSCGHCSLQFDLILEFLVYLPYIERPQAEILYVVMTDHGRWSLMTGLNTLRNAMFFFTVTVKPVLRDHCYQHDQTTSLEVLHTVFSAI